ISLRLPRFLLIPCRSLFPIPSTQRTKSAGSPWASRIASACSLWYTRKKEKRSGSSVHERQTARSGGSMKKGTSRNDEMRAHYDFTGGVRGQYARRYCEGDNVGVVFPPDARVVPHRWRGDVP